MRIIILRLGLVFCLCFKGVSGFANETLSEEYINALIQTIGADEEILHFYSQRAYSPLWVGKGAAYINRQSALVRAFEQATFHGLPHKVFDAQTLQNVLKSATTPQQKGSAEAYITGWFLHYVKAVQSGLLTPSEIDKEIARTVVVRNKQELLTGFSRSIPYVFFKNLPPQSSEYYHLQQEQKRLKTLHAKGGWGQVVRAPILRPGDNGTQVALLRNRLIAMGYLDRSFTRTYDTSIIGAVKAFQYDRGLVVDGVAGPNTLGELNKQVEHHLAAVLVAMERERWNNQGISPPSERMIVVNIPEYKAKIIDNGQIVFETNAVMGANVRNHRSPEFSDMLEYMVINPSWYVPRSIVVKEYLPIFQETATSALEFEFRQNDGTVVERELISFADYTPDDFPYLMRQPPSVNNALGLVKFMFPNRHNIYLHDTPQKKLFGQNKRAFSHGCIRLEQPFEFAYTLLGAQSDDPKQFFDDTLALSEEKYVNIKKHVPIHLIYRTAFAGSDGGILYRHDIYGRDAKIWAALENEGLALALF